jgi:hypothetical protein
MGTATMPRVGEIKLEYGEPQTLALRFIQGKEVQGKYGLRIMFTTSDDRKWFMDADDGIAFERRLAELNVQAGDPIRVTKIRLQHGGGYIKIEPLSDAHEDPRLVGQLEKSIEMARETRSAQTRVAAPARTETAPVQQPQQPTNDTQPITPLSAKFLAAYMVAVDVLLETRTYAQRKGLALNIECGDVRALAATLVIDQQKGGR